MKRHKSIGPMLRNGELKFWTPVNFEVEYFLNEETEGVLTDTVIYFSDLITSLMCVPGKLVYLYVGPLARRRKLYNNVIYTGGVSYSVGGAAAQPTLLFATPTSRLAIPYFDRFGSFTASKWLT